MERRSHRAQFIHWACGGISGCVAKTCVAPLDRVKILFQTRNQHYIKDGKIGVARTLGAIYREEGLLGLWRGNSATLFRVFPYASFQFLAYENYKRANLSSLLSGSPLIDSPPQRLHNQTSSTDAFTLWFSCWNNSNPPHLPFGSRQSQNGFTSTQ